MNRGRNILIWIITAIFAAGAICMVCVLNLIAGILLGAAFVVVNILLICLRPRKMGIWSERKPGPAPVSLRMPNVFPTEIRLVSTNVKTPVSILINKPVIMIGRSAACDFQIDAEVSEQISRRHAVIRYNPAERSYYVIAQETRNGTRLNHEMLPPGREHLIRRDDILELADVCFRVESAYH